MSIFFVLLLLRAANVPTVIRNTDIVVILEETGFHYDVMEYLEDLLYFEHEFMHSGADFDYDFFDDFDFDDFDFDDFDFDDFDYDFDDDFDIDTYRELDIADVERLLVSAGVAREVGRIFDDYARELARGNIDHHVTSADIVRMARNLEPEISNIVGRNLTETDFIILQQTLDDNIYFEEFTIAFFLYDMDLEPVIPFIHFAAYLIWISFFLCAFLLVIIYVHHRRNTAAALRAVSVPIIMAGLIFFIVGVLFSVSPQLFGYTLYDMSHYLGGVAHLIRLYGFAFIAFGILLIAISIAVTVMKNRREYQPPAGNARNRREY